MMSSRSPSTLEKKFKEDLIKIIQSLLEENNDLARKLQMAKQDQLLSAGGTTSRHQEQQRQEEKRLQQERELQSRQHESPMPGSASVINHNNDVHDKSQAALLDLGSLGSNSLYFLKAADSSVGLGIVR